MHQLRGAGRRPFGEIVGIHQHHAEAARRSIQRHPQARRAPPDHGEVVFVRLGQAGQEVGAPCGKGSGGNGHGVIVHGRSKNQGFTLEFLTLPG